MGKEPLGSNPRIVSEVRVRDLLKIVSLEEKIAQLGSVPALELLEEGRFSHESQKTSW